MLRQRLAFLWQRVTIPPRTATERNIYYLYVEVVFVSLLSVAGSFNAAYILRSGGSNALVGLLSSIPSLVAVFLFIPAARILERQADQMPWLVRSLLLTRSGYLLIVLMSLFFRQYVPEITVAILIGMTVPSVFFSTAWSPMLADVVPPRLRSTVFSWRSILGSLIVAPMILVAGQWLDVVRFPLNYQLLYAAGYLSGAFSVYLISRIEPPRDRPFQPPADQPRESWLGMLRNAFTANPRFGRIVANTFLFDFGAWLVGPLYVIFFVRQLGASDGWIGLNGALANIGVISGYWLWRKVIQRLGEGRVLLLSLPLACAYPFMVALVPHLSFILFAGFLINLVNPGVGLSHSVIFYEILPEGKKHSSTAIYSTVMNIGAFVAPLIGVEISNLIGIAPMLLIGGAMRLAGATLFYLFPIKDARAVAQPG